MWARRGAGERQQQVHYGVQDVANHSARRRAPLLLLLSETRTAAVYTTAGLVLQACERDAERAATVGVAIATARTEQPSARTIAIAAATAEPMIGLTILL